MDSRYRSELVKFHCFRSALTMAENFADRQRNGCAPVFLRRNNFLVPAQPARALFSNFYA
jgi:hypothetical protein